MKCVIGEVIKILREAVMGNSECPPRSVDEIRSIAESFKMVIECNKPSPDLYKIVRGGAPHDCEDYPDCNYCRQCGR